MRYYATDRDTIRMVKAAAHISLGVVLGAIISLGMVRGFDDVCADTKVDCGIRWVILEDRRE